MTALCTPPRSDFEGLLNKQATRTIHSRRHLIDFLRQGRGDVSCQYFSVGAHASYIRNIAKFLIKIESASIMVI